VEDEFSAGLVRDRVNDMTDEAIEVMTIEVSDETEAIVLWCVDGQLVVSERIDGIRW